MRFSACPAENMPFEDASFDGVLLNEVFEHVVDERQTLAEIRRVLRPGGVLALFSPNRWFPLEGHGLRVGQRRIHAPAPLIPWLPKRLTKPYVKARNYWPRELLAHVRAAGLRPRRPQFVFPMKVNYPWMPARLIGPYQRNVTSSTACRSLTGSAAFRPSSSPDVPPNSAARHRRSSNSMTTAWPARGRGCSRGRREGGSQMTSTRQPALFGPRCPAKGPKRSYRKSHPSS